jgi:predicted transcriptional regulator of viral defense system
MKGLSKKEIQVIADLEFRKKYYFTTGDIINHFKNRKQMTNIVYTLRKKERIIRLNKNKYFLVPIKARKGKWTDNPIIIADEICNGKNYYVGGWYAAHYWNLTDQIPMQVDIFTTKRQGKINILNIRIVFHRTTQKSIKKAVTEKIENHEFKIISKEKTKKWMKSRK